MHVRECNAKLPGGGRPPCGLMGAGGRLRVGGGGGKAGPPPPHRIIAPHPAVVPSALCRVCYCQTNTMCQGSNASQSDGSSEESRAGGSPLRRPPGELAADDADAVTPPQQAGGVPVGSPDEYADTAGRGSQLRLPPPATLAASGAPKRGSALPPPPEVPPNVVAALRQPQERQAAGTGGGDAQHGGRQAQGWLEGAAAEQQRRG